MYLPFQGHRKEMSNQATVCQAAIYYPLASKAPFNSMRVVAWSPRAIAWGTMRSVKYSGKSKGSSPLKMERAPENP